MFISNNNKKKQQIFTSPTLDAPQAPRFGNRARMVLCSRDDISMLFEKHPRE